MALSWPVTKITVTTSLRWVTGIPAHDAAATPAVTPGTTRLIVEGGYNGGIGSGENSALAGRQAWSGDSAGWTNVRLDLSSVAGSDIRFRWRFATNLLVGDDGWYVDDVVVEEDGGERGAE